MNFTLFYTAKPNHNILPIVRVEEQLNRTFLEKPTITNLVIFDKVFISEVMVFIKIITKEGQ